ncbi:hypothetical protein AB3G45_27015 [Shinella sp. S4-D37]|uniref:hypothetical protein n=1 Tax=Shinella sp. S4-D37 TaxID=3161999 RepID=UPI00346732CB
MTVFIASPIAQGAVAQVSLVPRRWFFVPRHAAVYNEPIEPAVRQCIAITD